MTPEQIEKRISTQDPWVTAAISSIRALIQSDFAHLNQIYKWNAVMWVSDKNLVAGVVPVKDGLKFCVFGDPIDSSLLSGLTTQRWGTKHFSKNLVFSRYGTKEEKIVKKLLLGASN
jgi:hypothetical protein